MRKMHFHEFQYESFSMNFNNLLHFEFILIKIFFENVSICKRYELLFLVF